MGMYDNIECLAPLPDGFAGTEPRFQTKSLDCELATYCITADGRLVYVGGGYLDQPTGEVVPPFHGTIEFYASNWSGTGDGIFATHDDAPLWSKTYRAYFTAGHLDRIEGGDDRDLEGRRHVPRAEFNAICDKIRSESFAKLTSDQHAKAMALAAQADSESDPEKRRQLFAEAAKLEHSLALKTHDEPSMSVLYRSAASLFQCAGMDGMALHSIQEWMGFGRKMAGAPPAEIAAEIADILRQIADGISAKEPTP